MSIGRVFALIVSVAGIATLIALLQPETPHATFSGDDRSMQNEAAAPRANRSASPTVKPAPSDARIEDPIAESAPLPKSSDAAAVQDLIEDLKPLAIPEILETEEAFATEAIDANWSAAAEAHILGEIAQVTGLNLMTLRVDCKTSLCRLQVGQRDLPSANPFPTLVDRLGMKPRWVVTIMDRNGVPTSLAYLERGRAPSGESAVGHDIEIRHSTSSR